MKCSQCQKENSPPDARFCVDCGYVLLQPCPYNCGREDLPVSAGAPLSQCPGCGQFLTGCPHCFRLNTLGARACPTTRCQTRGMRPVEPFAFHSGTAGGSPLQLVSPWRDAPPVQIEPGAASPSTTARFGTLASRYGWVIWWKDARLHLWPVPQMGEYWPRGAPRSLDFFEPPLADGHLPAHGQLLLAHGCAYALHQNGASRVPLNSEASATLQHLTLEDVNLDDAELEDLGYEEIADFGDDLTFGAPSFPGQPAATAPVEWELTEVQWWWQAATSRWWLGIGQVTDADGERMVGARARGENALFEGERWELPRGVNAEDWRELLVWDDAPALRTVDAIWREENGVWREVFAARGASDSLDGCVADDKALWVWGRLGPRLWTQRLEADSSSARASMSLERSDHFFPFPVVRDSRITFWVSGQLNAIVTLNVAHPLDDAWQQPLPANTTVIWATSVVSPDGAQWLVYATDDGEWVEFKMLRLEREPTSLHLIKRLRPLHDDFAARRGATVAATASGDALVVCYVGATENWLRAFAWSATIH